MALLNASGFKENSDSFAFPAGFNAPIFTGSVDLIKHWYYAAGV